MGAAAGIWGAKPAPCLTAPCLTALTLGLATGPNGTAGTARGKVKSRPTDSKAMKKSSPLACCWSGAAGGAGGFAHTSMLCTVCSSTGYICHCAVFDVRMAWPVSGVRVFLKSTCGNAMVRQYSWHACRSSVAQLFVLRCVQVSFDGNPPTKASSMGSGFATLSGCGCGMLTNARTAPTCRTSCSLSPVV